ncbi:response regulator transcription factor [Nonomuraea endophytica]|uniref:response regulator transcription factor n=1 Tax=Nonomuraea endophytica TaxID=714136 RepID=UPI0037C685E9
MRVLVVMHQDEPVETLMFGLDVYGHQAKCVSSGAEALHHQAAADVILLGARLPDMDGYEVCRKIRTTSNIPIIMVGADGAEFDRVLGLRLGADDYVVKPYSMRELSARIEAVARRALSDPYKGSSVRKVGALRIDQRQRLVSVHAVEIQLTRKEFELLTFLASEPGKVFSRADIMREVWERNDADDTRTLGVHISWLRRKLANPGLIQTVRGVGFRLVP